MTGDMQQGTLFGLGVLIITTWIGVHGSCLREQSRTVRQVVRQEIFSAFAKVGNSVDIPPSCPFHPDRDMYLVHENNKAMESVSRWVCQFCGKGFTAEHFLDRHFQNRHPEHVRQGREIVCLSDYCDIFRCDVIGTKNKVDFWQVALCIEDDLIDLRRKCGVTMDLCIPTLLSQNTSHALRDLLYQGVCSYLTCHTYWDTPFPEESQTAQILYVMACVFVLFVFIMYYCVVLNYYYSDDWDSPHDQWNEVTSDQMLWRPRSQYDPALAAQQRPRITATRRKAQHCPSPS